MKKILIILLTLIAAISIEAAERVDSITQICTKTVYLDGYRQIIKEVNAPVEVTFRQELEDGIYYGVRIMVKNMETDSIEINKFCYETGRRNGYITITKSLNSYTVTDKYQSYIIDKVGTEYILMIGEKSRRY